MTKAGFGLVLDSVEYLRSLKSLKMTLMKSLLPKNSLMRLSKDYAVDEQDACDEFLDKVREEHERRTHDELEQFLL